MTSFLPDYTIYSPTGIVSQIKENMFCQPDNSSQATHSSSDVNTSNSVLQNLSQNEWAKCIIEENKISCDFKLHTFTVMGSSCPYVLTLHAKETCSCPSTAQCYHIWHILTAKMAIGKQEEPKQGRFNVTQLHATLDQGKAKLLVESVTH